MAQFAFGGDTELEGALLDAGYVAVRWDAEMLRPDLEHIPEVPSRMATPSAPPPRPSCRPCSR